MNTSGIPLKSAEPCCLPESVERPFLLHCDIRTPTNNNGSSSHIAPNYGPKFFFNMVQTYARMYTHTPTSMDTRTHILLL